MKNLNLEKRLSRHPFLKGLSADHINLLAENAVPMVFQPGEFIMRQGKKAEYLFLVEKGTVSLGLLKAGQGGPITITTIGKGGNLGWSWAFEPYRWKFDARARTRVEILALEGRPTLMKMDRYPLLGYEMMKHLAFTLSQRLEATRHQLVKVYHAKAKTEYIYFPQPIL